MGYLVLGSGTRMDVKVSGMFRILERGGNPFPSLPFSSTPFLSPLLEFGAF